VAVLRRLTKQDLSAFARTVLAPGPQRRKLLVMIRGAAERRGAAGGGDGDGAAEDGAAAGPVRSSTAEEQRAAALSALGEGERLVLITDAAAYKRRCELYAAAVPGVEGGEGEATAAAATAADDAPVPARLAEE